MNKKEIFNKIYKNLLNLSNDEFFKRLEKRKHSDIYKALNELGVSKYILERINDKKDIKED